MGCLSGINLGTLAPGAESVGAHELEGRGAADSRAPKQLWFSWCFVRRSCRTAASSAGRRSTEAQSPALPVSSVCPGHLGMPSRAPSGGVGARLSAPLPASLRAVFFDLSVRGILLGSFWRRSLITPGEENLFPLCNVQDEEQITLLRG